MIKKFLVSTIFLVLLSSQSNAAGSNSDAKPKTHFDKAVTYILDSDWSFFFKRNQSLFSKEFQNCSGSIFNPGRTSSLKKESSSDETCKFPFLILCDI